MNLCIVCARCVRVCDEVRGDDALTLQQRSGRSLIGTSQGNSLLESGCEFCGACIDVCPTGALVERKYKWDKAVQKVQSICPQCPVGCQMTLEVDRRNRMIRAIPDRNGEANRGQGCFKGKFGLDFVNNRRQMIRRPLVRRGGQLEEASWHDALDAAGGGPGRPRGRRFRADSIAARHKRGQLRRPEVRPRGDELRQRGRLFQPETRTSEAAGRDAGRSRGDEPHLGPGRVELLPRRFQQHDRGAERRRRANQGRGQRRRQADSHRPARDRANALRRHLAASQPGQRDGADRRDAARHSGTSRSKTTHSS